VEGEASSANFISDLSNQIHSINQVLGAIELSIATPSIMTLSIMKFSKMTLSITTLSIMAFNLMAFSIATLSIMTFRYRHSA
jgi:hypothetical protein